MSLSDENTLAVIERLKNVSLFSSLPEEVLFKLMQSFQSVAFEARETIIKEGSVDHQMYILIEGQVSVFKTSPNGSMHKVAVLKADQFPFIGEGALIDTDPRSATVQSDQLCQCLVWKKSDFERFCQEHPEYGYPILMQMARGVMARLRKANKDLLHFYQKKVA